MSRSSNKTIAPSAEQNQARARSTQQPMTSEPINPKLIGMMLELSEIEERERFLTDRVRQIKQQKHELELYLRMIQASKKNDKRNQQNVPRQQASESSENETDSD